MISKVPPVAYLSEAGDLTLDTRTTMYKVVLYIKASLRVPYNQ